MSPCSRRSTIASSAAALGDDAEPRVAEMPVDQRIEPARLDRPAHEMKAAAHLRETAARPAVVDDFPAAEMPGDDDRALALRQRAGERLGILDAHARRAALVRHQQEQEEARVDAQQVQRSAPARGARCRLPAACRRTRAAGSRGSRRGAAAAGDRTACRRAAPPRARTRRSRPPRRWRGRASATAPMRAMRWRCNTPCAAGEQTTLRRAVVVARDREVGGGDRVERRLARKKLEAGFLRGEARSEARRAARGHRRRRATRARSTACAGRPAAFRATAARCARSPRCRCRSAEARRVFTPRTSSAVLVLPNPRDSTSATLQRGAARVARHIEPRAGVVERRERRDPGHDALPQRLQRQHRLERAGCREQVAERPLEPGDRRHPGAEHAHQRARFGDIGIARAVGVRDDHADIRRGDPGVVEREAYRAREALAIIADRQQAFGFGRRAAADQLALHARTALVDRFLALDDQRRRAFAENAAVARRVVRRAGRPATAVPRDSNRACSAARSAPRGRWRPRGRLRRRAAPPAPRPAPACR